MNSSARRQSRCDKKINIAMRCRDSPLCHQHHNTSITTIGAVPLRFWVKWYLPEYEVPPRKRNCTCVLSRPKTTLWKPESPGPARESSTQQHLQQHLSRKEIRGSHAPDPGPDSISGEAPRAPRRDTRCGVAHSCCGPS